MIDLETIEREISELEARETSYHLCERLAWLYVVRDHQRPREARSEPFAGNTPQAEGSDFLRACSGLEYARLMEVLDEHMAALSVVQPREYQAVMGRIEALKKISN